MKKLLRSLIHRLPYIYKLRAYIKELDEKSKSKARMGSDYLFDLLSLKKSLNDYEELIFLEMKFGGYITNVSPKIEDKLVSKFSTKFLTGGDRFNPFYHDYSKIYSKYFKKLRLNKLNLLEVGILKGTGLAIWSEYFDDVDIFGFDWDLGNIKSNLDSLLSLGAFKKKLPNLFHYNQLINNEIWLKDFFNDILFDIVIDDALHSDEAIINTFIEIQPYLSKNFVYFIEDNRSAYLILHQKYPEYFFDNYDELTVVTKK